MADIYVRSGAGGTNDGSSWANAYISLQNAIFNHGAGGDTYWVSEDHNESGTNGNLAPNAGNALTAPYKVICVNHAGSVPPSIPTDLRTTAVFATTGGNSITAGPAPAFYRYWYGITFNCGTGANNPTIDLAYNSNNAYQIFDKCSFNIVATGSTAQIRAGTNSGSGPDVTRFRNCTFSFGATGQSFGVGETPFTIEGGSIAGATLPTTLFKDISLIGDGNAIRFDGVDFSAVTGTLIGATAQGRKYNFVNCKLGSGVVVGVPTAAESEVNILISDSGTKSYRQERYKYQGTLTTETIVVRTGGASDGITPISWKCVETANNGYITPFKCFEIAIFNSSLGVGVAATVELLTDNVILKDNEVWMDLEYLGSASVPQSSILTSASNIAAAGSNLATSGAVWTTTGLGTPKPQRVSVSFTPQMIGLIRATLYIAKPSVTIWVDPALTVA